MKAYNERQALAAECRINASLKEAKLISFISPAHDTPEWHQQRREGIGSSDAPAILGLSSWSTPEDIWNQKRGEDARPFKGNSYTWFGNWFEDYLRQELENREGIQILEGGAIGQLAWDHWPVARANLDGLSLSDGVIEEFKTSSDAQWRDVPPAYYAQVQHQLMVTGAEQARLRQFLCPINRTFLHALYKLAQKELVFFDESGLDATLGSLIAHWLLSIGEVVTWPITRDDAFIERLYKKEYEFWECVQNGTKPEPISEEEAVLDLSSEPKLLELFSSYAEAKWELKQITDPLKEREEELKSEVRNSIEKEIALSDIKPKKIICGPHKAVFISSKNGSGDWRLYTSFN